LVIDGEFEVLAPRPGRELVAIDDPVVAVAAATFTTGWFL
jgi:hypothetical protein